MTFWQKLLDEVSGGEPAFLVCVAANTDGSPGTAGAKMFVRRDGSQEGTIGGGAMELSLLERAVSALQSGAMAPFMETLWHRKTGPGLKSGMICSGSQTNVYLHCDPDSSVPVLQAVVDAYDQSPAARLVIDAEGWRVEAGVEGPGAAPVRLVEVDDDWRYEERLINGRRVAIVGGGHCGKALSRTMHHLGFHVAVYDTRPDVETMLSNAWADEKVVVDDYEQVGSQVTFPEATRVVVMTSDYPSDVKALAGAMPRPFPFVGVMGSQAKINQIKAELRQRGFTDEQTDALHAPIGIPIHSHTPEEIAISVAADLLQHVHACQAGG